MRDPEDWNNRLDFNGKVGIQNLFECSFNIIYRVVAQLVALLIWVQWVAGSSPVHPT